MDGQTNVLTEQTKTIYPFGILHMLGYNNTSAAKSMNTFYIYKNKWFGVYAGGIIIQVQQSQWIHFIYTKTIWGSLGWFGVIWWTDKLLKRHTSEMENSVQKSYRNFFEIQTKFREGYNIVIARYSLGLTIWSEIVYIVYKRIYEHIFWLCWGLTTHQPLWVILCPLPEKARTRTPPSGALYACGK